ncbi:MAG: choice-of-anchor Q domain-containing protein, partial [Planctomycetota bacterium]
MGAEHLEDRRMPAVITVTNLADNLFPNDGVSLREAIIAANSDSSVDGSAAGDGNDDTIEFAPSLFGPILLGSELPITAAVTIDATALGRRITIDAQQNGRVFNIDDPSVTNENFDVTLAGLTLTGGRTTGDNINFGDTTNSGGAVRSLTSGTLSLDLTIVRESSTRGAYAGGGALFATGDVMLTQSTLSGNKTQGATARGGGVFAFGDVTLVESSVTENRTQAIGADGGGVTTLGDVTLIASTLSGNATSGEFADGGGIYAVGGATLVQSTVSGNDTFGDGASGGGVMANGPVTVTQSTVTRNIAYSGSATGGGIWSLNDPIVINGSIISGNQAGTSTTMRDIDPGAGTLEVNFSLIGPGVTPTTGVGNQVSDVPLLAPLAENGGLTQTHLPLPGSLAIDNGDPGFNVVATPNDQRGAPFVRGFGSQVDIGAVERQSLPSGPIVVTTTDDELNFLNSEVSLREAIALANGSAGLDTITFANALSGRSIMLTRGELTLTEAASIDATALAEPVTVSANRQSRLLNITADVGDFTLAGLTLTNGRTVNFNTTSSDLHSGGAVRSQTTGLLTLDRTAVRDNATQG